MKLDLDADNVIYKAVTTDQVRERLDDDEVYSWLDEAQSPVFSGEKRRMFLVVEIMP